MEDNINISERIDRYILGEMNEAERQAFEAEMSSDPELKKEYEVQREIALAVQRVHLKRHMQDIEKRTKNARRRRIETISSWSIAAAIACICIVGLDMKWSSDLKQTSTLCYTETGVPISRSDSYIDELVFMAYQCIGEGDLEVAINNLDRAETLIEDQLRVEPVTDEEEYRREILLMQKEDVEWYRTLILMKQGKIFKSRKALKNIANSESRYADKARKILETIYPF